MISGRNSERSLLPFFSFKGGWAFTQLDGAVRQANVAVSPLSKSAISRDHHLRGARTDQNLLNLPSFLLRSVLFVADLFHPLNNFAIQSLLDCNVCHCRRW